MPEVKEPEAMRTYVLPYSVIRRIEHLARQWGCSKKDVVIRAVAWLDENDPRLKGKEGWDAKD